MEAESIQLVELNKDGEFKLNGEALTWLSNFLMVDNIQCPLAVVSVVGKYRTGKSYLINKLLVQNQVF